MIVEDKITTDIELKDSKIENDPEINENPLVLSTTETPLIAVRGSGGLPAKKIIKKKQKTEPL